MKKKVSLVQVNFQQGPRELNAFYLPYTVGILWSYLQSQPGWSSMFELEQIVWKRDPIDQVVQKISNSDVILYSTYIWNRNFNYILAEKIKAMNPAVITVFGGPELPHRDPEIFQRYPFIDYIVKQEGELTIHELLTDHTRAREIKGLVINDHGMVVDTGDADRVDDLNQLPSPYLNGFFDKIIENNPGYQWNATLETNRGCPYQCTFCDWGSLTYSKIKKFNLERLFDEIEWIGANCDHITCADANFGMFVERDELIADKIIEVYKKYDRIKGFHAAWAKNQKADVIKIIKKLNDNLDGFSTGLGVAVQSMDSGVLDIIKRKNLNQHQLSEIFKMCEDNHIPVYTEMILGLPGETLTSWKNGVYSVFEHGNHNSLDFIQAQILENAEMNYGQKNFYKMETVEVYDYMSGIDELGDCVESIDIVISTRSMPYNDMIEAQVWTSFIIALHLNSLTSWVARFLRKYLDITYADFYNNLYQFMKIDGWIKNTLTDIEQYFRKWTKVGYFDHPPIGGMAVTGVNIGHRFLIDIYLHDKIDHVLDLTKSFVHKNYDLPKLVKEELFRFQKDTILEYDRLLCLPDCQEYQFDFLGYISDGSALDSRVNLQFATTHDHKDISKQRFLENLYYARKRFYTKLKITPEKTL